MTNGSSIASASRKRLLGPHDNFFEHQRVLQYIEQQIYQLFHLTCDLYPQINWLSIYGELFGGAYPHLEVMSIAGLQAVQTGIYYSPDIQFCAFDLAISGAQFPHTYLDYDQAITLLQNAGLFYAAPLFIGSYQKALDYPIEFSSTIPARLGLPPLSEDNKAEGIVIKPLKALTLSTKNGVVRPIFKRKIAIFAEDKRFHQAQHWSIPLSQTTNKLDLLTWEAFNQITENRLRSAISKIGYRSPREPSKSRQLFQLFITDILEQLAINQPTVFATLTTEERNQLIRTIQQEVRTFLKEVFQREQWRI